MPKDNKIYNFLQKNRYGIYAFFITLVVWIITYINYSIFPFGNGNALRGDAADQYLPMIIQFKEAILGKQSLIFNWNSAMGQDFFLNFCYYLTDPTNLLIFLFPRGSESYFITLVMPIKVSIMAFTCSLFLRKMTGYNNFSITAFSLIYSLSGFVCIYSFNIIWLNGLILCPLLVVSLFDMVKTGKNGRYILYLFLSIYFNFFMALIECIFLCFVFLIAEDFKDKKKFFKNLKNFILSSILSATMAGFILIPVIFVVAGGSSEFKIFNFSLFGSYLYIFSSILFGSQPVYYTVSMNYAPIYFSVASIMTFMYFLGLRSVNKILKTKISALMAIIFISTNIPFFNFIFNGLHFPIGLPNRFVYIMALVFGYCGVVALNNKDKICWKFSSIFFLLISAFCVLIWLTGENTGIKIINTALVLGYGLLLYLGLKRLFIWIMTLEISFSGFLYLYKTNDNTTKTAFNQVRKIADSVSVEDYERTAFNVHDSMDISILSGNKSIDGFSSMINPNYTKLSKFGILSTRNAIIIDYLPKVMSSLLGVKVFVVDSSFHDLSGFEIETVYEDRNNAERGLYAGSKVIMVKRNSMKDVSYAHIFSDKIKDIKLVDNVFDNINNFVSKAVGETQDIYSKVNNTQSYMYSEYNQEDTERNMLDRDDYYSIWTDSVGELAIYSKTSASDIYSGEFMDDEFIATLGRGRELEINNIEVDTREFYTYLEYDERRYNNTYKNTPENMEAPLEIAKYDEGADYEAARKINDCSVKDFITDGNKIYFNNIEKEGILTVSTLYSDGWTVKVNGKKTDVLKIADLFIGVNVKPGDKVKFVYHTPGLFSGVCISIISFVVFIYISKPCELKTFLNFLKNKNDKKVVSRCK